MAGEFRRLFQRPLMRSYLGSLLGVGYDSERERSLSYTLVASTLFLTVASGYTTWTGLCEYLPGFIALVLTLGIQGLLYAAAWRLGASLNTRAFRVSLLVIYLVTMATSVFFSYSALLNVVYRPAARQRDQLQRARLEGSIIATEVAKLLEAEANRHAGRVRDAIRPWSAKVLAVATPAVAAAAEDVSEAEAEHGRLTKRSERETNTGGTMVTIGGRLWITPSGRGEYARRYEGEADQYYFQVLVPAKQRYQALNDLASEVSRTVTAALRDNTQVSPEQLTKLDDLRAQLSARLPSATGTTMPGPFPRDVYVAAELAATYQAAEPSDTIGAEIAGATSVDSIKGLLLLRLRDVPRLDTRLHTRLLQRVESIGELQGADVHQFALAIGELWRGNVLAVGALLVGLAIDGLILLCGILGARPESYLDMRNPDDLLDVQELVLETIMGLNLDEIDLSTIESRFVRRCVTMLSHANVDTELAYRGLPAVLPATAVEQLRLIEVGVLLALNVARKLDDGRLALRTRFIIWIADRIQRYTLATSSMADIDATLREPEVTI